MFSIENISSVHLDILKEIGNIGAGHSATALSTLLGRKIEMKVPSVRVVTFDEMMELAGGPDNVVACVFSRIKGNAPGSMFFILSMEQANLFIRNITGDSAFQFIKPPYPDIALSALEEIGNILSSSYLTSLSNFTNLKLLPSVPALSIEMAGAVISYGLIELSKVSDYAIVIDTALIEETASNINSVNGHVFLLPDPDSFETIFSALGVPVND
ncbi:chemotaxis protein CheC [Bacillus massiliigorillae]|uniref:chemotaxis protein CheC n=1 Tax=Bacillus massiliigorillae TaxID=1243664 RepID=UPI0003A094E9|nr:chemotaxis protein CheC [Bacillus massiliigorillae]